MKNVSYSEMRSRRSACWPCRLRDARAPRSIAGREKCSARPSSRGDRRSAASSPHLRQGAGRSQPGTSASMGGLSVLGWRVLTLQGSCCLSLPSTGGSAAMSWRSFRCWRQDRKEAAGTVRAIAAARVPAETAPTRYRPAANSRLGKPGRNRPRRAGPISMARTRGHRLTALRISVSTRVDGRTTQGGAQRRERNLGTFHRARTQERPPEEAVRVLHRFR